MELEVDRSKYDVANPENLSFKSEKGLSEELVRQISQDKGEPAWLLQKRLQGFQLFQELKMPNFGPSLKELNLNEIHCYLKPNAKSNSESWDSVPEDIRKTYENLGIPEAERKSLAGVGAQYESLVVYHNLKKELSDLGVIFLDFDEAVRKFPEMVKKYFMTTCVSPNLHKFAAMHSAVFSGGTFIYVPKNVKVTIPLQAYFRMNSKNSGQFEHTLIIADENSEVHYIEGCSAPKYSSNSLHAGCVEIHVLKNAKVRYSSIENWSKNTYNLNTKRAIVSENGKIEWVNGNLGSRVTMLYPCSILAGKNASSEYLGIAVASKEQIQDTGCKVYHLAENTNSLVLSRSISQQGGVANYRGLISIKRHAKNSKSHVSCEGLILDDKSSASTIPAMDIHEDSVEVSHEATTGKIREEQLFYLQSRGLSEREATKLIISGFLEPIVKTMPLEYAVELNRLIEMEIEESVI